MQRVLSILAVLTVLAELVLLWRWQHRIKPAPSSGGASITVQLADSVHFRQGDPLWASDKLGTLEDGTLGEYGCTVAAVAMAMTNLGYPTDPGKLNAVLTAAGGVTRQGWLIWDKIAEVTNGALRAEVYKAPSLEAMDACLMRGDYPVVKFFLFGGAPHWVVLVGKRNGTYFIRDPLLSEEAPAALHTRTSAVYSVRCIGLTRPVRP